MGFFRRTHTLYMTGWQEWDPAVDTAGNEGRWVSKSTDWTGDREAMGIYLNQRARSSVEVREVYMCSRPVGLPVYTRNP